MSHILSDLRFALRTLKANPIFTAIAVTSLALGIGANTAIFSVVESALLRGLPFHDADQLVYVRDRQPCCAQAPLSPGEYLDYRKQTRTLSGIAAFSSQRLTLTGGSEPQKLNGLAVTTNYFEVLGAQAERGRLISSHIDKPTADTRVAVLSDSTWRSLFASDPSVIGHDITLNDVAFRVIGVLPARQSLANKTDIWISPRLVVPEYKEAPLQKDSDITKQYGDHWLSVVARLRAGVTVSQARAELSVIAANIAKQYPAEKDHGGIVLSVQDSLVRNVRPALWVLLIAVILLLLIACANLASLLLGRATGRTRELAVRVSLGATRGKIVRLLLTESLLLAVGGGILGVAFAQQGLSLMALYSPYDLPAALTPELNFPVLAFCIAITLLAALFTGIIPALRAARTDVNEALKEGSKGSVGGGAKRLRQILVSAEMAISIVLLAGASLLTRSFSKLISVDPGFDPKNVVTARLFLPDNHYPQGAPTTVFWERLVTRLSALPDVQAAGLMSDLPFAGSESGSYLEIEGRPKGPNDPGPYSNYSGVSPATFEALHVPLIAGRPFNSRDNAKAPLVAVVSKAFVRKIFPNENPIGRRFKGSPEPRWFTIVGVVADVKQSGLDSTPVPQVYFPYPQLAMSISGIVLRAKSGSASVPSELRTAVRGLDPNLPVTDVKPLEDYVGQSLAARRFLLGLLTTFSAVAILLAGIGLYGVLAYSVQQQRREIGIRMTLGARSSEVLWIVLRECLAIAAFGLGVGFIGAIWSSSFLKSMLFNMKSTDLLAHGSAVLLMIALIMAASLVPALRASRVDPVAALRYE